MLICFKISWFNTYFNTCSQQYLNMFLFFMCLVSYSQSFKDAPFIALRTRYSDWYDEYIVTLVCGERGSVATEGEEIYSLGKRVLCYQFLFSVFPSCVYIIRGMWTSASWGMLANFFFQLRTGVCFMWVVEKLVALWCKYLCLFINRFALTHVYV